MKLTTLLLFLAFMQVSAKTFAQKVTLNEKNAQLSDVFEKIRTQTGYDFAYTTKVIQTAQPVTIIIKDVNLTDALDQVFGTQPLKYRIEDKTVTVTPKPVAAPVNTSATNAGTIDVSGNVWDEKNQPIPGATVIVKGTNISTITASNGTFHLKNVPENSIIVVSFIGYQKTEVTAKADMEVIHLVPSVNQLDAVQVIAYGQTTQRNSTGNIAVVSAKDIESQPVTNPLLALQGKVPGLYITQATGIPGSGVTVRIQGQNSIQNGNDPLYVIDGMPYTSQLLQGLSAARFLGNSGGSDYTGTNNFGNPLNYLNPADIESITVLKDADATAIYGSRAANGAILITTKRGKAGPTKVDIKLQDGWGNVDRRMDLLNTQQYLAMRAEAFKNDNATPSSTDYDVNGVWDKNSYTDWQKVLLGGTAKYNDFQGDVSGGTENVQYLIGANYNRQTTVFPGNFADQKASMHVNLSSQSANRKFKIQFSANYQSDNDNLSSVDLTQTALILPPDAPTLYKRDGSLNWAPDANGNSSWYNPLSYLLNTYNNKTTNLISSGNISYNILPGLDIKTNIGFNDLRTDEIALNPIAALAPEQRPYATSNNTVGNNDLKSWTIEPQLTYNCTIGDSKLNVLLGSTLESSQATGEQFFGNGYTSDLLLSDINAAPTVYSTSVTNYLYRYAALFGRINYSWKDRYIIDLNARRDGSSRFGADNQFHDFGSIGVAWIFSDEKFIKDNISCLSYGKLRGSYGITGSDQIPNYGYVSNYGVNSVQVPYQQQVSLYPKNLSNPFLQWEETRKLSIGAELGFMNDRILLTANYSKNQSSNQLLGYNLPFITGFNSINENFPATVENTNWEFTLNTTNVKTATILWTSGVNFTIPHNKLVAFPNLANSSFSKQLIVGQPINIFKVFNLVGVDPASGQYQYRTLSGQLTTTPDFSNDTYKIIMFSPKFYGGMQNSFRYRSWQLDFSIQFTKQLGVDVTHGIQVIPGTFYGGIYGFAGNQPVSILNRWQKPGDKATIAQFTTTNGGGYAPIYLQQSTAGFSDASYVRLKNARLSWELPKAISNKIRLSTLKLFAEGQNLLTITKYTGMDPESGPTGLPPLRIITTGIQTSF